MTTDAPQPNDSPAPLEAAPVNDLDDDFGVEELGERQVEACSMEPGCTVCE